LEKAKGKKKTKNLGNREKILILFLEMEAFLNEGVQ